MKKRPLTKALPATVGIMALLLGLMLIDKDIHAELVKLAHGGAAAELVSMTQRAQDSGLVMFRAAKDQILEHGPLTAFTIVSAGLLLFMLRT